MRRFVLLLAVGLCGPDLARGQDVHPDQLRAAVEFPMLHVAYNFAWDPAKFDDAGNPLDLDKELARHQQRLKGTLDDATVYLDLATCHGKRKDNDRRLEAYRQVEALVRPHLDTTDPKKADLLLYFCDAQCHLRPQAFDEWERYAQRAAELAPGNWRVWAHLASMHRIRFNRGLVGDQVPVKDMDQAVLELLHERRASHAKLEAAAACVAEMRRCSDRAVALAPQEKECRQHRYATLIYEANLRNVLAVGRGAAPVQPEPTAEMLAELQVLARLSPDVVYWQFLAATAYVQRPAEAKFVAECLDRLDALAQAAAPEIAVRIRRLLLSLTILSSDYPRSEKYARLVVQHDPADNETWESLETILCMTERTKEAIAQVRLRLQKSPSARNHHLLAKYLCEDKQWAEAEKVEREAVRRFPDDAECQLGLAALLLKNHADRAAWQEADRLLDRVRNLIRPGLPDTLVDDLTFLRAVHQALTGEVAFARPALQYLCRQHPQRACFARALAALGK